MKAHLAHVTIANHGLVSSPDCSWINDFHAYVQKRRIGKATNAEVRGLDVKKLMEQARKNKKKADVARMSTKQYQDQACSQYFVCRCPEVLFRRDG